MKKMRTRKMMKTMTRPSVVCAFDYAFVVLLVESEASCVVVRGASKTRLISRPSW